jgi:Zn-dependent metalloprotease
VRRHDRHHRTVRPTGTSGTRLRVGLVCGAASIGAAVVAVALALIALSAVVLALGAGGVGGVALSGHPWHVALEDGVVAFYLVQLVSLSFFDHSADLRFAALPGLALVAAAIAASAMVAVRLVGGSVRRRMLVACLMAVAYALLAGLGARLLPLRFTGFYIGNETAVAPAGVEAFVLPLIWGLLFAPVGGLVGVFGRRWREEAHRLLGAWAIPVWGALRALTIGLSLACAVTIVGGFVLVAGSSGLRALAAGSVGHLLAALGGALIVLPTLVLGVFLSCFGVAFDWHVEALARTQGSGSILGGTLPSIGSTSTHGVPSALVIMFVLATATVVCAGWLTARRSGRDVSLGMANALRAGLLMTLACWLFGLLMRVDAQAGGYLGLHLQADAGSLLWRAPLWCLLGSGAGGAAFIATRGASARRQLAAALLDALRPARLRAHAGGPGSWRGGLAAPAVLSVGFLSLPAVLIGIGGSAGAAPASQPAGVSLAPVRHSAEATLRRDAVARSELSVTVDQDSRVADAANARIPLSALGVSPAASPVAKGRAVLARYGNLFGASGRSGELGEPEVAADPITKTRSHVYFKQMVDGVPVFGNTIGIRLSRDGRDVESINGSFLPDVTLATAKPALSSARAVSIAKALLPAGRLVHAPRLEIYAGPASQESGPDARLAWFVWLAAGPQSASNEYVVDATTGSVLHVFVRAFYSETPDVEIDNAENKTELPGKKARWQGEGVVEPKEVDNAYEDLEEAFEFYRKIKREPRWFGYNETGTEPELATVDYGKECNAAEWYPALQEIYLCEGFAKAPDVVGHEYAAAVIEHSEGEVAEAQAGAIAEGFADAMGEALESYKKTSKKEAEEPASEWKFGLKAPKGPFRNLKEPRLIETLEVEGKKYHDPEKLSEYLVACIDGEAFHEDSTIISHAFYLLATKTTVATAANIFFDMQAAELKGQRHPELEQAEKAAVAAAKALYPAENPEELSTQAKDTLSAFEAVELNGVKPVPTSPLIGCTKICTFQDALTEQEPAHGTASTLTMLATLYKARGALADNSAAGHHFMPLYEQNMGRITELVSRDPTLEETAVDGLAEIGPALNALAEGNGQKYELSAMEMAKIEAALKRLAQDDRLISGGGTLAAMIERELKWLHLSSYAGMTYQKGFARLNAEVQPLTSGTLVDPNCGGTPYHNEFQVNEFTIDTPGHHKPGEVSPILASGVACGAAVEVAGSPTECEDKSGPLNEKLSLELPPGDKIDSSKEMESGSYIGETSGRIIACAGDDSKGGYGVTGITSIKSWSSSECPTTAIACYEVRSTFKEGSAHGEGHGYGWVEEKEEKLVFTTGAEKDTVEEGSEHLENVPISFGEFHVKLCARAGKSGTDTCGGSSAPWVHKNGEESPLVGCSSTTKKGRYIATVTNTAKETTQPAWHCVYWGEYDHKQVADSGKSLSAVSCVPETQDCVIADSSGNALYSTNVSATAASTWTAWSGLTSPGEALACPSTALCVFGDGKVSEGGGGDMYYATSLGETWKEAFKPTHGVLAASCPSASFCVAGQEGGHIRYSTNPKSTEWTEVTVGSSAVNGVNCISPSFCAAVNGAGDLYVATSEAHVKETAGWKLTDIDGSTALHGVACTSTTACVAVDGAGDVIELAVNSSGEVKEPIKRDIDGTNSLTAVSCVPSGVCAAADSKGNVFVSNNGGASWHLQYALGVDLTSVSCASPALCVAADTEGHVTAFVPQPTPPSYTQKIDSSNSVSAVSCIPSTTECVVTDNKGNALYDSAVSEFASSKWTSWSEPLSPSEAIACPAASLCTLADGEAEPGEIGGNMYHATSLGGAWTEAFNPAFGVLAVSCASTSLCVDGQEGGGYIRYSTKPASSEWTSLSIGSGAMNAVDCLSSSFCAVVDSSGHVHVADTEAKIKEVAGWKSSDIEGSTALHGIACISTTTCFVVDDTGNMLEVTINGSGEATAAKEDIDGTNELTAVACTEGVRCVAVDNKGNVFAWNATTGAWNSEYALGTDFTSVSCSAKTFCLAADTTGEVTALEPESE